MYQAAKETEAKTERHNAFLARKAAEKKQQEADRVAAQIYEAG